eukprot:TRINITY_DN20353_c0_g1_i2.p1 TRINITY_DN20353_c0_g1~~TRINITY_DN20353_c0_g1_i2.p1  ORF type:complete len:198 (+),score=13.43 TRINITY_DN20353_c0_g1_i2:79-594(+)
MSIQDDRMDREDETNKESASQKLVRGTSGIEKISQGRAPDPTNSSALLNPIVEKGAFSIKSITKPVETSSIEDYSLKGNTQMNKVQVHESGKKDVFAPSLKKGQHSHKSSSNTTGGRVNLPRKQTNRAGRSRPVVNNYSKQQFHLAMIDSCLLYTSPSPRDLSTSRMPSSA